MTVEQIQPLTFLTSSSFSSEHRGLDEAHHSAAYLGLVLIPGSLALGLAQLLVLFVVQQRVVLVKRHNLVLAGLQQLREEEILTNDGDTFGPELFGPEGAGGPTAARTCGITVVLLLLLLGVDESSRSGLNM